MIKQSHYKLKNRNICVILMSFFVLVSCTFHLTPLRFKDFHDVKSRACLGIEEDLRAKQNIEGYSMTDPRRVFNMGLDESGLFEKISWIDKPEEKSNIDFLIKYTVKNLTLKKEVNPVMYPITSFLFWTGVVYGFGLPGLPFSFIQQTAAVSNVDIDIECVETATGRELFSKKIGGKKEFKSDFWYFNNQELEKIKDAVLREAVNEVINEIDSAVKLKRIDLAKYEHRNPSTQQRTPDNSAVDKGEIPLSPSDNIDIDVPVETLIKMPDAVAVVIGNKDYQNKDVPSVDYAIRDAAVVKDYLIKTFGFREENIIYQENATFNNFASFFGKENNYKGKLFDLVEKDKSEIFIYYSGHGAPDIETRSGYFIPIDGEPSKIKLNGYSIETLYKNLAEIAREKNPKKITVVIDSCFSGGTEKGTLIKGASPIIPEIKNPLLLIPRTTIFTSAGGDQISSWHTEKKHSLFTYFFLKGIQGKADLNNDKQLIVEEIEQFIRDGTEEELGVPRYARKFKGREQTPVIYGDKKNVLVRY